MKKEKLVAAIDAVLELHERDPDMGWCVNCETTYPCPTARAIHEHTGIALDNPCPYTHSHTRHWCGYPMCREG